MFNKIANLFRSTPQPSETRTAPTTPKYAYRPSWVRGFPDAGVDITPESVYSIPAFDSCVNRIADDLSGCPWRCAGKDSQGRNKRIYDHPRLRDLNEPNELHSAADVWYLFVSSVGCFANYYEELQWNKSGTRLRRYPLLPQQVEPELNKHTGWLSYRVQTDKGTVNLSPDRIHHVKWRPRPDGLKGRTVYEIGSAFSIALAAESYAAKFFGNGTSISGYLKTLQPFDPDANDERRKSWQEAMGGVDNAFQTAILNEGDEFVPLSVAPEQAQFLQSRLHQVTAVCGYWGIKSPMIGDLSKLSFATYDAVTADHVKSCIRPWCTRVEQEVNRKYLTEEERDQGIRFWLDTEGLMRGDRQSQDKSFSVGKQFGWYSTNDIRCDYLNLDPIEGGDRYNEPLNMAAVSEEEATKDEEPVVEDQSEEADADKSKLTDEAEEPNQDEKRLAEERRRDADRLNPILHDAIRRCLVKEVNAIKRAVAKECDLNAWAADWYEPHADLVRSAVLPAFTVFDAATATGRAADYATQHVEDSKRDIADAMTFEALPDLYETWINRRPFKADLGGA